MGILSRKEEMQILARNLNQSTGGASSFQGYKPNREIALRQKVIDASKPPRYHVSSLTSKSGAKIISMPVLSKRYTQIVMNRNRVQIRNAEETN